MRKLKETIKPIVREADDENNENQEEDAGTTTTPAPTNPAPRIESDTTTPTAPAEKKEHSLVGGIISYIMSKIIPKKIFNKIDGALWGMIEGYITGSMVGAYNVGRGGWMSVLIADTIGSPVGGMIGALGGTAIGAMSDRTQAAKTIGLYRELPFKQVVQTEKSSYSQPSVICNRANPSY